MKMPCRWISPYITEYTDGELGTVKTGIIRAHIGRCSICSSRHAEAVNLKSAVRGIQSELLPDPGLKSAILKGLAADAAASTGNRWFLRPEFSFGLLALSVVIAIFINLIHFKPALSEVDEVISFGQETALVTESIDPRLLSDMRLHSPGMTSLTAPSTLTLYNRSGMDGESYFLVAHMIIRKDKKLLSYHHGRDGQIMPLIPSGIRLSSIPGCGVRLYAGDFEGYRLFFWEDKSGNQSAVLLSPPASV